MTEIICKAVSCFNPSLPEPETLISSFRPRRALVAKIEQGKVEQQERESKALARQVSDANLAQVKAMVEMDVIVLREKLPGKKEALITHELDMKYLRDRQLILVPALCRIFH